MPSRLIYSPYSSSRMKCLILAAGFGTRLASLYPNTPKQLVPVANRPVIDFMLDKVNQVPEIDEVFLVTNAKFASQFEQWKEKSSCTKKLQILNNGVTSNETRRGSIGDILFAKQHFGIHEDLLILGGDNILGFSLKEFVDQFNHQKKPMIAVFDVKDKERAKQLGIVEINDAKKIIDFIEKPPHPKSTLASTLVYMLPKESLALIDKYASYGLPLDRAGDYIAWLTKQRDVQAFPFEGIWFDIGTPEQLREADEVMRRFEEQ